MHVSRIYSRFSPEVDQMFRQAMILASRHRVLRVHHIIAAAGGLDGLQEMGKDSKAIERLPSEWVEQAATQTEQDTTGCLDSPMTNSPTTRRVLQLACDRAGQGVILSRHLLAMALCCWREEKPPGRGQSGDERQRITALCGKLDVSPLPAYDVCEGRTSAEERVSQGETETIRTPTVEELEEMIGPAITTDDLICLYIEMKKTTDPALREWLAWKLNYLCRRG